MHCFLLKKTNSMAVRNEAKPETKMSCTFAALTKNGQKQCILEKHMCNNKKCGITCASFVQQKQTIFCFELPFCINHKQCFANQMEPSLDGLNGTQQHSRKQ